MVADAMGQTPRPHYLDCPVSATRSELPAMPSNENIVHIAIELSTAVWLVGTRLPGAAKSRMHRINAGDTAALLALVGELRARPVKGTGQVADLACCFEAGRDGFWLHRLLTEHGVSTYVV